MFEHDPPEMVLRGGHVADGTGRAPARSDVLLSQGRVVAVEDGGSAPGAVVINAEGLVVAPGLIDVHTHADLLPFVADGEQALRTGALMQGVTTVIAGNCGFSVFPLSKGSDSAAVREHLATLFGEATAIFEDLAEYGAALALAGLESNVATLVGQGTLRAAVVGFEDRKATEAEIAEMRELTVRAFEQGALGLSTGLLYPPGSHAETDELVELARVAASWGRPYVSHIRNEMDQVAEGLAEAIDIGRQASVAVQVSHLKAGGRRNHGRLEELLGLLDEAAAEGVDVAADAYPYTRSSTVMHALLPPWVTEGGIEAMIARLADPDARQRVGKSFEEDDPGWQNFISAGSWDDVTVASAPFSRESEGRTVAQLAADRSIDPVDLVADMVVAGSGSVTVTIETLAADDVARCLASNRVMLGSDGIPTPGKPHPRWAGSFSRALSKKARDAYGLSVAEAVHKMTAWPARRFGLVDRGVVAVGAIADLVIFDSERVEDRATYQEPLLPPEGVEHVIVGGHHVVDGGVFTGGRAGRFLTASQN